MFLRAFLVVCGIWIAFEIALDIFRRADTKALKKDEGSLRLLTIVIYASVGLGVYLSAQGIGAIAFSLSVRWLGVALIVAGLLYRLWAVLTLRRFFTVDIAIHSDQHLVQNGPYRFLRHPSYTGSLLSFLGLSIALSNWISAIVILLPITGVFLNRIRVEESALQTAFPETYATYSSSRARLIPGLF